MLFRSLLVFLGLLGTFWGLLETVASIAGVIANLGTIGGDINQFFNDLKTGLQAPLGGMGTAFSSSMLGLAGSLVLGFLDLQASQAQNRFYNELEEWLASLTRLSSGVLGGDAEGGGSGADALSVVGVDEVGEAATEAAGGAEDHGVGDGEVAEFEAAFGHAAQA